MDISQQKCICIDIGKPLQLTFLPYGVFYDEWYVINALNEFYFAHCKVKCLNSSTCISTQTK